MNDEEDEKILSSTNYLQRNQKYKSTGDFKIDPNDKVVWQSCCFNISKPMFKFISTFIISLIVICLCCYQIVDSTITDKSVYTSLLCVVLGIYLPQPNIK